MFDIHSPFSRCRGEKPEAAAVAGVPHINISLVLKTTLTHFCGLAHKSVFKLPKPVTSAPVCVGHSTDIIPAIRSASRGLTGVTGVVVNGPY
ncbi:MAG: hypothetical protein DI525_06840 [Corynebacterium kroppenstedtii]|uniref:Uncharacterized protein n=1 Tax=Corynebacterium kroppenstedtii TaxID=161879 RepID=A0A2W5SPB0_9CORY|nr:MAG: hypothetical protein DI525_06840 [Corynebacterium kroppenstedtii]